AECPVAGNVAQGSTGRQTTARRTKTEGLRKALPRDLQKRDHLRPIVTQPQPFEMPAALHCCEAPPGTSRCIPARLDRALQLRMRALSRTTRVRYEERERAPYTAVEII